MTAVRVRLPRRLLGASCALVLGAATLLLAGCNTRSNIIYGTGVISLNNAPGDFTSYIVNIDDITLTRNDGILIEPLATTEAIDLTKVHDLAELLETPAFPVGTYTSLSVLLDYSVPYITVDVNGTPTSVLAVDSTGATMSTVQLTVNFDPQNPLVINNQQGTRVALNFDLSAFNSINLSASPITVTVVPFMTATPMAVDSTPMRARGLLVISQPESSSYIVNMRPFNDVVSALGALTVNTSASTYFNVNGTVYTGAAGLTALKSVPVNSTVVAYGTLGSLATITPTLNATEVYAGSATQSPLLDYATGTVSALSGDNVTLDDVRFMGRLGGVQYFPQVPVTLSASTVVTQDGVAAAGLSPASVSVGQLINVAGQGVNYLTVGIPSSMDATAGAVRLQPTPLWGTLTSATPGNMTLSLLSLGNLSGGAFTFAGTGSSSANDAVFGSYAVNTGAIDESGATAGTLFQASGTVTPFGSAPPDFTATSVSSPAPQQLVVEWPLPGSTTPFSSASSAGLVVNLANAAINPAVRYLATGPQKTDLTTLAASPTIVFSGTPILAIGLSDIISVYNSAGAFATALATQLNGTNAAFRLSAVGQYDAGTNTFTATQVAVNLVP